MKLLKKISRLGTTVVISAHTVSNLDLCDEIIFMGSNGQIAGSMNYKESLEYFKVEKFVDIYEILINQIEEYSQKYLKSFHYTVRQNTRKKQHSKKKKNLREIYYLSKR